MLKSGMGETLELQTRRPRYHNLLRFALAEGTLVETAAVIVVAFMSVSLASPWLCLCHGVDCK